MHRYEQHISTSNQMPNPSPDPLSGITTPFRSMCWTRTHGSRKSKHLKSREISLARLGSQECQIQQHAPRFSPPDSRTSPAFYVPQKSCSLTPSNLSRIWLVCHTLCSRSLLMALSSPLLQSLLHYLVHTVVTTAPLSPRFYEIRGKRRLLTEPYGVSGGLGDERPAQQIFSTFPTDLLSSLKPHMSILRSQFPSLSQFVTQAYHKCELGGYNSDLYQFRFCWETPSHHTSARATLVDNPPSRSLRNTTRGAGGHHDS